MIGLKWRPNHELILPHKPELELHKRLFSSRFKKACVEIAFLIRIKEGVRQPGLECEAFATNASDAICAECGEELILARSVVRFNTDFCSRGSDSSSGFDSHFGPQNCCSELN